MIRQIKVFGKREREKGDRIERGNKTNPLSTSLGKTKHQPDGPGTTQQRICRLSGKGTTKRVAGAPEKTIRTHCE